MDKETALKILRELHDKALFSERTALETLHPELKESEDERIRKAILNYFTKCWGNCKDDVCGVHVEDAIAWLEKQGEQKPMTEEFEHELAEICNQLLSEIDSEWMNNEILDCIGTSVWLNLCDETAKRYKDGLLKLAKQGEQKPAEWGEEDETTFKVMLEELEKYVMFKQYSTPLSVYDLQWFKSLKDRVQPQPKQE